METNDIGVGEIANYSCWPGYTHVSGDLTRTCLTTLVLSGRRPTCELTCTSIVRQKCIQCKGETGSGGSCPSVQSQANVDGCLGQLPFGLSSSVAVVGGNCYEYDCKESIDRDPVSDRSGD